VGVVVLQDWREEFVLTLAHELRHIDQFWWTQPPADVVRLRRGQPANIEHDAESFGVKVLNEWRKTNGRAVILPFHLTPPAQHTIQQPARRAARRSK
jgi:hypothetical protein